MEWFAVRHVIEDSGAYEERVTLWEVASDDEAIARAEEEASLYAAALGGNALGLFQSYRLDEPPAHGREIFSLIRTSALPPEQYLDTFFDSGHEHQRTDG